MVTESKIWTVEEVKDLLRRNDEMVRKSLIKLYHLQTIDELNEKTAKHRNDIGFNRFDAAFGTDMAQQVIDGVQLTDRQIMFSRQMLRKYAKQLTAVANGELRG